MRDKNEITYLVNPLINKRRAIKEEKEKWAGMQNKKRCLMDAYMQGWLDCRFNVIHFIDSLLEIDWIPFQGALVLSSYFFVGICRHKHLTAVGSGMHNNRIDKVE